MRLSRITRNDIARILCCALLAMPFLECRSAWAETHDECVQRFTDQYNNVDVVNCNRTRNREADENQAAKQLAYDTSVVLLTTCKNNATLRFNNRNTACETIWSADSSNCQVDFLGRVALATAALILLTQGCGWLLLPPAVATCIANVQVAYAIALAAALIALVVCLVQAGNRFDTCKTNARNDLTTDKAICDADDLGRRNIADLTFDSKERLSKDKYTECIRVAKRARDDGINACPNDG